MLDERKVGQNKERTKRRRRGAIESNGERKVRGRIAKMRESRVKVCGRVAPIESIERRGFGTENGSWREGFRLEEAVFVELRSERVALNARDEGGHSLSRPMCEMFIINDVNRAQNGQIAFKNGIA